MGKVVEVSNLRRDFGSFTAIEGVSFSVEEGEILVIVGASGCGKTTTLRCIAGLETITSGSIQVDGRLMAGSGIFVPPEKRGIGMVFQSYALWPHKTVAENVGYSLQVQRRPRHEIGERVDRVLATVGLAGMGDRYPATLSGGQQQRVALARCAVAEPRVMLLDEPLSNLDAKLREQMRDEVRRIIKAMGGTAIHITHDQAEAMALADRIVYLRNGRVEQIGSGRDLYRRPANRFVADFIGITNFLDGQVIERRGPTQVRIACGDGLELVSAADPFEPADGAVTVSLRPESLRLHSARPDLPNVLAGTVQSEIFLGDHIEYTLRTSAGEIRCRSLRDFALGSSIFVAVDPHDVVYFRASEAAAGAGTAARAA